RDAGLDLMALLPAEVATRLVSRPSAVVVDLAAYIDDWSRLMREKRNDVVSAKHLMEVAQTLDPDPWRQRLRETMVRPASEKLAALQELARSSQDNDLGPISLNLLGQALSASG